MRSPTQTGEQALRLGPESRNRIAQRFASSWVPPRRRPAPQTGHAGGRFLAACRASFPLGWPTPATPRVRAASAASSYRTRFDRSSSFDQYRFSTFGPAPVRSLLRDARLQTVGEIQTVRNFPDSLKSEDIESKLSRSSFPSLLGILPRKDGNEL